MNQITEIEKPIEKPIEKIKEMPKKKKQIRGKRGPYRKKQKIFLIGIPNVLQNPK